MALFELKSANVAILGGYLILAHAVATIIYRLYLHPLSKYPGRFWARVSTLPSFWHTLKRDRHVWLLSLQQQYGSTFRYGPNQVVMNTPTAYRALLVLPKGNTPKSMSFYPFWPRRYHCRSTIQTVDPIDHGRQRRVLNAAFSDKALREYEPYVISNVQRWCQIIQDQQEVSEGWSVPLDMADWVDYVSFDIMGDLCLGRSFNTKEEGNEDKRDAIKLMAGFSVYLNPICRSPISPYWIWLKPRGLDWLVNRAAPKNLLKWWDFIDECLNKRIKTLEADKDVRKDFSSYLFQGRDAETGQLGYRSYEEFWEEMNLLVVAGADTTSTVLAGLFFYLSSRPDVQDVLHSEIVAVFPNADDIRPSPALMTSCKYLKAVIQEGLRMTPPVPADLPRTVGPGGTVVDGQFFPCGVDLRISPYCLNYNPDVYPDPFAFLPDRWLVPDGASDEQVESVKLAESGLSTFSAGARGCVGKNLAWLEMSVILANVIRRFHFRRAPGALKHVGGGDPRSANPGRRNVDQFQTYEAFVSLKHGPMVQFRPREVYSSL